ncbi:MAG: ribonuclease P protein component [Candidatus Pacebacteria bacterium]|nr:ribonuclease P protein component [Candidatus Paceibacterota bacterium]MCF7857314.1 ribonuclease P protein component [Candidatus Paceibacterota bacterium]
MLPKKERLSREEFNRFFLLGKRHHTPSLQIVYVPHPTLQVSVVVSKKIAKLAVERNKIRRRIYDIVKNCRPEKKPHGIFIFIVKTPVSAVPYAALRDEVVAGIDAVGKKFT